MSKIIAVLACLAVVLAVVSAESSSSGSNETHLGSGTGVPAHCGRVPDVLVITTSVRMLHGVHCHSSHLRPAVPLHLVLVVGSASLQQRLVNTSSTGNDANRGTGFGVDHFLGTRRQ